MKNTNTALSRIKLVLNRNNCKRDNLKTIIWIPLKWPKKKKRMHIHNLFQKKYNYLF